MSNARSAPPPSVETPAYFGHHKCGSTWILSILSRIGVETGRSVHAVYDTLTPQASGRLFDSMGTFERADLPERVERDGTELVLCIGCDSDQLEMLRPCRGFHVIRDPRDLIVSAYFSHRYSHPTDGLPHLQAHREDLERLTLDEGIFLEMDFSSHELDRIRRWNYDDPAILELKLEDLSVDPYGGFLKIADHLGMLSAGEPATAIEQLQAWSVRLRNRLSQRTAMSYLRKPTQAAGELVLSATYRNRYETKSQGRHKGSEDVTSHYRKGTPGDWRNYFTQSHINEFDRRFSDLPQLLGYQ